MDYATACRILGDVYIQTQVEISKLHKQYGEQLAQKDKRIAELERQNSVMSDNLDQIRKSAENDDESERDPD